MNANELEQLANQQCLVDDESHREIWIDGFIAGHIRGSQRPERWKPIDVYLDGRLHYHAKNAEDAAQYTGMTAPNICSSIKADKKTRKGYYFKYGKITDKGIE